MATENYVYKLVHILVEAMGLTIADSEEELKKSVEAALSGWTPEEKVVIPWGGESLVYPKGRRIFPRYSYYKGWDEESQGEIWIKNRPWGEGSNEDVNFILYATKRVILGRIGLAEISWETAQKYDVQFLKQIAEGLRNTTSDRGPGSPYTQSYDQELNLAIEFGVETVVRWHDEMHKANWADFVSQMYGLWKLWGKEAIVEVDKVCGKKIRWFTSFASDCSWQENMPKPKNFQEALSTWKRSNWVHAITKIGYIGLEKLDKKFGRRRIDYEVKTHAEKISSLNEDLRPLTLECLMMGDDIAWMKNFHNSANLVHEICEWAEKRKVLPSIMNAEMEEVIKGAFLQYQDVTTLLADPRISWDEVKAVVKNHGEIIKEKSEKVRAGAVIALHLFPEDDYAWLNGETDAYDAMWVIKKAQEINSVPSEIRKNIAKLEVFGLHFGDVTSLSEKIGWRNAILWPLEFKEDFEGVLPDNLLNAILLHRAGDDVSWLKRKLDWSEYGCILTWAKENNLKPSQVGEGIGCAKEKTELTFSQLQDIHQKIGFSEFAKFGEEFSEQIYSTISACKVKAVILLSENSARNTNWWPQATDSKEFDVGVLAEELGREGLAGIQRRRWLQERLGLDWTPEVDKKLSWEESSEIIAKNPWLKTALSFINKEQTILDLASGKDISYLKYIATEEELKSAQGSKDRRSCRKAIKSTWTVDVWGWFEKLEGAVGKDLAWEYIGNRSRHDQLFFVDNMLAKLSVKTLQSILLQVRADFGRFGQAVNAYEPEGEINFQSFKEFTKHVELQKGRIIFPQDATEIFRERIAEMLEAPGVSVSAIRSFMADRKNWPLILGEEDDKAVFPPMKIEFTSEPLEYVVTRALGKRNPQRPEDMAQAEKPELLFKKLGKLAKTAGLKTGAIELTRFVPEDLEQEVINILREHKMNLGTVYTAEVARKSDPIGWTSGDWTNCCMQFGSTKNDEYMRRRDMSYFLVSNSRLMAQSVVVAAAHTSRNGSTPKVETANLSNIDAVGLDNVEVAPNYKDHRELVENIYRKFWRQYSKKYGKHLDVVIGKSHNDALPSTITAKMVWKPLEKMAYSDCFGNSEAYVLVESKKKEV